MNTPPPPLNAQKEFYLESIWINERINQKAATKYFILFYFILFYFILFYLKKIVTKARTSH
jgi:hypothetical protein